MPPVRWRLLNAVFILNAFLLTVNAAPDPSQEAFSASDDGWRPIVGTQREPAIRDEIKFYRNPIQSSETVKAETLPTTTPSTTTAASKISPTPPTIHRINNNFGQILRVPTHSKHPISNQYFVLPNHGSHGPHIPLIQSRVITQNSKGGPQSQMVLIPAKRIVKPVKLVGAHSTREEIYLPAPPQSIYAFTNKGLVKTRETVGVGIPGSAHYHSSQDYPSHFTIFPADNVFQYTPVPSFVHKPPPQSNEVHFPFHLHNDEFTQNLVPPPFKIYPEKQKQKPKEQAKESPKEVEIKKAVVYVPEAVIGETPPPPKKFYKPTFQPEKVEVQVTKEKLKVFHNTVPPNFNIENNYHTISRPQTPPAPPPKLTYEVTESNSWGETPPYQPQIRYPDLQRTPVKNQVTEVELSKPFLPTPYKPEVAAPTRATQNEAATIFTELSQRQKQQNGFSAVEVSTHYPILGRPANEQPEEEEQKMVEGQKELSNEITTTVRDEIKKDEEMLKPVRPHRRRRPIHRERTTTTEEPVTINYERPRQRIRKPLKHRTTTTTTEEPERSEINHNLYRKRTNQRLKIKPTTERSSEEIEAVTEAVNINVDYKPYYTTSNKFREAYTTERSVHSDEIVTEERKPENEVEEESNFSSSGEDTTVGYENYNRRPIPIYESQEDVGFNYRETVTEVVPVTEITTENYPHNAISIKEVVPDLYKENKIKFEDVSDEPQATVAETTSTTTTTTEAPTTTKSHRIRGRPNKYDNKNRPRFSVKEYRQRLNQYSSTTTESQKLTSTESPTRIRYPNRSRRPLTSTTESTTTTKSNEALINDKPIKSVNTRLRPFGRYRSTTEATTTQKVSIRPNIFSNLRRPTPISLRKRIYTRKNATTEATTEAEEVEEEANNTEVVETTAEYPQKFETSTEFAEKKDDGSEEEDATASDILKSDSILKRVSDLTSSAKNEYETPGLFKAVPTTSRKVPNYFTIATDDPILPIETVFANIKDKEKKA